MKKRNESKNKGSNFAGSAIFTVIGHVMDVYEGKKADYATVRVWRGEYYSDFTITVAKDFGVERDDKLRFDGDIKVFWDDKTSRYRNVLEALTVEEVEP